MLETVSRVEEPGPATLEREPGAAGTRQDSSREHATGVRPRVVIVGGGFGGLYAARALRRADAQVTLVDRNNYHLFQPLLYQVATGALSPGNIAAPLRSILSRQKNAHVLLAEAVGIDAKEQRLILRDGELPYDYLVLAPGAGENYFGNDEWRDRAPSLKTLGDALEIRRRVLVAFEQAERATDPAHVAAWLTFAVVGGGPTGVELAGAIAEIARHTLRGDFRTINPADSQILLLENDRLPLNTMPEDLSRDAHRALERLGVTVQVNTQVTGIAADAVTVRQGGVEHSIPCRTVIWAAGIKPSPLAGALRDATCCELDRGGRVIVQPDLTVPGHPELYVIGDMAHCRGRDGEPLPGIAPVAMQQAGHVGRAIRRRIAGRTPAKFNYRHYGMMATIGRAAAVADLGRVHLRGWLGWLAWLFIHLMYIVQFEDKLLVLIQWAWNYVTWNRSARLITETGRGRGMAGPGDGGAAGSASADGDEKGSP